MNMIFIPATKPEDWRSLLAKPDLHWKVGCSAMQLAYSWQEAKGFPHCIERMFKESDIPLFDDIESLLIFPEYKVPLPGGRRPSQNDVFVLAKGKGQLISIMVEGKVSESFGEIVSKWRSDPSPGKEERLNYLCGMLALEKDEISNIRYQLLHRTASAIIEAKKFNATNAIMIVHSFSKEKIGFEDYSNFASLFRVEAKLNRIHFAGNIKGIDLYLGWVMDKTKYNSEEPKDESTEGIVTARECDCCGHHELGITTKDGKYIPLKPGMKVKIIRNK